MPSQRYSFNKKEHVHTLDGRPLIGVSSVGSVIAKPLTWWASGLAVSELGWTNPKLVDEEERIATVTEAFEEIKTLTPETYLAKLDTAYKAHAVKLKTSAEGGTDRHALAEEWVKDCIAKYEGRPESEVFDEAIASFVQWAKMNVKRFLWSEGYGYSERYWLGGISDIGAEVKDGKIAVIDLKSSKDAYSNQFFQIAGYDLIISENGWFTDDGKRLGTLPSPITQYVVFPFGMKEPTGIARYDTEKNREAFLAMLTLYKQINNYK
jgi:hypothetical protein